MTKPSFDDSDIRWQSLPGIDHLHYSILDIDEHRLIIDVLFKFASDEQILLHRHKVLNHMLVIQGEHRLYEADGRVKDIRPTGRYTVSPPSEDPHREGGGKDQDAIVYFSIRGSDGVLYEILDDRLNTVGTLSFSDFVELNRSQAAEQSLASGV
jgi:hypothetical protein